MTSHDVVEKRSPVPGYWAPNDLSEPWMAASEDDDVGRALAEELRREGGAGETDMVYEPDPI